MSSKPLSFYVFQINIFAQGHGNQQTAGNLTILGNREGTPPPLAVNLWKGLEAPGPPGQPLALRGEAVAWHTEWVRTEDTAVLATRPGPAATLLRRGFPTAGPPIQLCPSGPLLGNSFLPTLPMVQLIWACDPGFLGSGSACSRSGRVRTRAVVWWVNETFTRLDGAGGWSRL